jgi:hypothetical protein
MTEQQDTGPGRPQGQDDPAVIANGAPATSHGEPSKTKESFLAKAKRLWLEKTGIDKRTYMQMLKGALAPTIAISAYQGTAWADNYTTLGYLVGIMSVLSVVIQPRAKFIQTMMINVFSVCLASAIALLAGFCAVKARINSEGFHGAGSGGPGTSGLAAGGAATAKYNSSGAAVAGVWLFAWIYGISVVRAKGPQFTIPCIMNAIFANVSMVYAPQFDTIVQLETFVERLLEAFLTGMAIATGVSLLIFPLTSRQIVFKEMANYIQSLRTAMKANLDYLHSLEDTDVFAPHRVNTAGEEVCGNKAVDIFKAKMQALQGLHAKLSTDLPFAKREIALGKLGPDDIQAVFRHLRSIMLPTVGLSSTQEVFARIAEQHNWDTSRDFAHVKPEDALTEEDKIRAASTMEWHELMRRLREPFGDVTDMIDEGLQHAAIVLQLAPKPKARDAVVAVEDGGEVPKPGDRSFPEYYNAKSVRFLESKKEMLRAWCSLHEVQLPDDFFDDPYRKDFGAPAWMNEDIESPFRTRVRRQVFICLYMEYLLYNVDRRVYDLIMLSEALQAYGKLSRTRIIVPGIKRLRKWFIHVFARDGEAHDDQQIDTGDNSVTVYLGQAYKKRKDPEHLPPQNAWENASDSLRILAHFFASPASSFGFRVACATMSIAIVAYLRDTQAFFTRERLFWSQIMISISMSPTSGQSVRNFLLRIIGTFIAMCLSWVAYYIVDGQTAGVLVFYFVILHFGVYILIKRPQITPVGMISQVTMTLIIGYELQVRKVGVAVAESNGQTYYPIYELGPIRLATVCGGLFLAWIWTVFPYPTTEHSQLRQNTGRAFYLLANYYSILTETVRVRLRGAEGELNSKDSPGYKLEKSRRKVFSKCNILFAALRAQSGFIKFDIPIGGRFPRQRYQAIIGLMQSCLNFMSLVSIASADFSALQQSGSQQGSTSRWLVNFRRLIADTNVTSEQVTTLLSLLSAAVSHGHPLPPHVKVPEPYALSTRLDQIDQDILSVRHIAEPGYSAFAVIQIGTRCVIDDLHKILKEVKELVGELDFSYHIVSTQNSSRNESEQNLTCSGKDFASEVAKGKEE